MKDRLRLPLWLICDAVVWLRLSIGMTLMRRIMREVNRAPWAISPELFRAAARVQTVVEGVLRWAILRRARRINGLSPRIPLVLPTQSRTYSTFCARQDAMLHTLRNIDRLARRFADRMKQALAVTAPSPHAAFAAAVADLFAGAPAYPSAFAINLSPNHIRGPPARR